MPSFRSLSETRNHAHRIENQATAESALAGRQLAKSNRGIHDLTFGPPEPSDPVSNRTGAWPVRNGISHAARSWITRSNNAAKALTDGANSLSNGPRPLRSQSPMMALRRRSSESTGGRRPAPPANLRSSMAGVRRSSPHSSSNHDEAASQEFRRLLKIRDRR